MSPLRPVGVIALAMVVARTATTAVDALRAPGASPTTAGVMMANDVPKTCPITKPPSPPFIPPAPYPAQAGASGFWFGTERLWIRLPAEGTWRGLGHYRSTDTTFRQKLLWWRQGYDWRTENPPKLKVTGRRLDSQAPPFEADNANAGWTDDRDHPFIVVGVDIPTLGCWKITGHYEGVELNFVIWVAQ